MKVSELWLREWITSSLTAPQLAALLTMAGLEVDSVNAVAGAFDGVIVARVESTLPHPKADRLTLCEINTGTGPLLNVVCGATNVRVGLKVALAQIGAQLPGGLTIKESKLRGETSQGMLCSAAELGLADYADGIMELEADAPIGVNLRDYLFLNDQVFDIDLTPNRADCFSVLGIAREVAALTQSSLKPLSQQACVPATDTKLAISLQAAQGCPQYCGRVIHNINPQASTPQWMKERLRRSGLRAIHPVVDVTNYVMLELGQPMHAFDYHAIKEGIIVRFAEDNERLTLLDGQQVALTEKILVIADHEKPLAMAGVMGGEDSAVQECTTDIFLESAFFNPLAITGVARNYGLCSDSSQRYERGVDPALQLQALERATALLLEIVGGVAGPISFESQPNQLPKANEILFNPLKVKQLTGLDVTEDQMTAMLCHLGMKVDHSKSLWQVKTPSYRFDLRLEVDLVEEIIRLYGYDKLLGERILSCMHAGKTHSFESLSMRIAQWFIARGYYETISYSFVDPGLQQVLYPDVPTMQLLNPISPELSQMRVGMWPGLIASMIYNIHRQQTAIKFFEQGVVFNLQGETLREHPCIAGLLMGEVGSMNWSEQARKFDFYDVKGDLEFLFESLQLGPVCFVAAQHPALHPGKSARILIANQEVGWCGVLHPRVNDALDLSEEVVLFELNLLHLVKQESTRYLPISKFPQIRRDLCLLMDNEISMAQVEKLVEQSIPQNWLKSFDVFDVYTGETIPAGKKSIAIALTLQDDKRTLIDTEINTIIDAILKKLEEELAIVLRL